MPAPAAEWTALAPKGEFLCLSAEIGNITRMESAILACCPQNLNKKSLYHLRLLVDEIFSNVCRHAYGPQGGEMGLYVEAYDPHRKMLYFWVVDWGDPFDPLRSIPAIAPLDLAFELDSERPLHQLGLYLIGQVSTVLEYKRAVYPPAHLPAHPARRAGREANLLRVGLALQTS